MTVCLMFPDEKEKESVFGLSERTLLDLSMDRFPDLIGLDAAQKAAFLGAVRSPSSSVETVIFRQEILNDFLNNPDLSGRLSFLCGIADQCRGAIEKVVTDKRRASVNGISSVDLMRNCLQTSAVALKRLLLMFADAAEALSSSALRSRGLSGVLRYFSEKTAAPDFGRLLEICRKYERFGLSGNMNVRITLDGSGKISSCHLIDRKDFDFSFLKTPKRRIAGRRPDEETAAHTVARRSGDICEPVLIRAVGETVDLICDICSGMLSDISLLGSDLEFYVSAVKFTEFLKERGVPVCFPRVSGVSRGISATGLFDTFLALGGDSKPVPNDVSFSGKGVLIYGENGSGKTVFLRSLATARILFQCGFPVPAETAEFPVAARICAVFAEAENKDNGGTGSGRFENEVKAVAVAIGTLTPGSAVFFNEVFQSTEYREASEGFADILSYLTDTGVRWTAVTHLDELKDCLPEGSADILTTVTGFRVISVL